MNPRHYTKRKPISYRMLPTGYVTAWWLTLGAVTCPEASSRHSHTGLWHLTLLMDTLHLRPSLTPLWVSCTFPSAPAWAQRLDSHPSCSHLPRLILTSSPQDKPHKSVLIWSENSAIHPEPQCSDREEEVTFIESLGYTLTKLIQGLQQSKTWVFIKQPLTWSKPVPLAHRMLLELCSQTCRAASHLQTPDVTWVCS